MANGDSKTTNEFEMLAEFSTKLAKLIADQAERAQSLVSQKKYETPTYTLGNYMLDQLGNTTKLLDADISSRSRRRPNRPRRTRRNRSEGVRPPQASEHPSHARNPTLRVFASFAGQTKPPANRGQPKVAVFGAGIAGLTVAHELAVRGFAVDVFETSHEVGGLAATQLHASRIFGDQAEESLLPGEHGFRAFYSFYRHTTDTMSRIPLPDPAPPAPPRPELRAERHGRRPQGPPRTVADNLIPTYKVALAIKDNVFREIEYDRRQPRSAAAAAYALGVWMVAMGFSSSDINRVLNRLPPVPDLVPGAALSRADPEIDVRFHG